MAGAVIGALRVILGADTAAFEDAMKDAADKLKSVGKTMQSVGKTLSVAVTAPVVGFGAAAVKVAGDFEAAMNRVQAASGATADQMGRMQAMALDLGASTSKSAAEAAAMMEMLVKNGVSVEDILGGAAEASIKLSEATGGDLATSADVATNVMAQFKIEVGQLGKVVDGITGVTLASQFGFEDYKNAIAQAGGVAGSLGVSIEEFNAAIAATSSVFNSGSDAGTSFKTFLTTLVPKSDGAAAAMQELGLEFFEVDGSMKSMAAIAQELQDGLSGLSDEAKNTALTEIFGQDAMRTAVALADQGAAGIQKMTEAVTQAGLADEQSAARMKGFNGELEKLSGAFETLQLAIANSGLLAFMTEMTTKLADAISWLSKANPAMLKWGTVIAAAAAALGPLLIAIGLFTTAMAAISAPVYAVVAALAAVAGGITLATQAFQMFGDDIIAIFKALPGQMMEIGRQIVAGLWEGFKAEWALFKQNVSDMAGSVAGWVKDKLDIRSPSRVMAEVGKNVVQGLDVGMKEELPSVQSTAEDIGSTIGDAFMSVVDGSKSAKEAIGDLIKSFAKMALQQINFGSLFGGGAAGGAGGGGGFLGGLLNSIFGGLPGFANGGSFKVGGAGGIDSQLVAFKASPDERVSIHKPGAERSMGGGVVIQADFRGADAQAVAGISARLDKMQAELPTMVNGINRTAQARGVRR
ncbi:phage tail tape measure protein [Mongoliimonas terrestris]|uniref:phage tail tape measure protein n=1 Tax=Mongoliimonas terrestris TaxID=1709001 RepID=UPI00094994B1|nr:phage tail tape measure protein [Mongoliimonas terrestris]